MKIVKNILAVFILSIFLGMVGVNALGEHLSFVSFKLKNNSGIRATEVVDKKKDCLQYMYTSNAIDNITGGQRAVSVQTVGKEYSDFISAPKGSYVAWADKDSKKKGGYYLRIKATKDTFATVSYNGTWFLDDALIN